MAWTFRLLLALRPSYLDHAGTYVGSAQAEYRTSGQCTTTHGNGVVSRQALERRCDEGPRNSCVEAWLDVRNSGSDRVRACDQRAGGFRSAGARCPNDRGVDRKSVV